MDELQILPEQEVKELFIRHEARDEVRFMDVGEKLDKILYNHLSHMEPDLAETRESMAEVKEALKWNTWLLKGFAMGVGSLLLALILAILTKII